ncbi:MAG: YIP1 family protein [Gammaproteobacteria bacterium]
MSTANLSSAAVLTDIITAPARAFAAIRERPTAWLPLMIVIAFYCAVSVAYTSSVDLAWLIDQQLQQAQNLTDAQRDQAVKAALRISPAVYGGIGAVGAAIFIPLVFALTSLYYSGVSFVTGDGVKYKQWFALASWCAIPIVFGLVAALVHVLAGDARFMRQEELNPFSFGNLLGVDMATVTRVQRGVLGLDITLIWSVVLSILGYQAFSKRSLALSAAVVLAPIVLIVGIIAVFALR